MSEKLLIDCDPGIDDAIALMIAKAHPACDIVAVTTVSGNQAIDKVTSNALCLAELLSLDDVPIAAGAAKPLVRDAVHADVHGETGLGGWELPHTGRRASDRTAVDVILDTVRGNPAGTITLVAIGPLTNIALALRSDPTIAERFKQIVIMGGAVNAGNITPTAEFNFYADAEAADEVLRSGGNIVMLGLDLTWQSAVPQNVLVEIRTLTSPVARAVEAWLDFYALGEITPGEDGPSIHDACAVAYVIDPRLVTTERACVLVETQGRWTYGSSVVDRDFSFEQPENVSLGTVLDRDGFWRLVVDSLRRYES